MVLLPPVHRTNPSRYYRNSTTDSEMTQVSKYLPIWEKLKRDKRCRITAPIAHHKTIIKMVKNKRDDDTAYRFELAEKNMTHTIKVSSDKVVKTVIVFTLIERITINGL